MDDAFKPSTTDDAGLSRRDFATVAAAGAVAVSAPALAQAAPRDVVETDVTITTADGSADAALYHPAGKGSWPGVVMFTDALGLRPAYRDMGKRLAAEGYTVLIPNPFYRTAKAPVITGPFDFGNAADRAKLGVLRAPLTLEATNRDAQAWVAFLDKQPQTSKRKKLGVVGYCMGGPMVLAAASLAPTRVAAGCSFHGGGLVTDKPDSPHLLVPSTKAAFYFGIANNDDKNQPAAKDALRAAYDAAKLPAIITVYTGANHGWCMKDGGAVYNEASAEIAWANMLAHYRQHLA